MEDVEVDLFGDPCRLPSGRRGRPAHMPTQKNCNKVMMLLAMGWSQSRIANALHITVPTLTKHYFSILKTRAMQRDRLDARRMEVLWGKAEAGDTSAMREFNRMLAKNDSMIEAARLRDDPPSREEPIGKKEQERRAALEISEGGSDDWGDDLMPGVRVN